MLLVSILSIVLRFVRLIALILTYLTVKSEVNILNHRRDFLENCELFYFVRPHPEIYSISVRCNRTGPKPLDLDDVILGAIM